MIRMFRRKVRSYIQDSVTPVGVLHSREIRSLEHLSFGACEGIAKPPQCVSKKLPSGFLRLLCCFWLEEEWLAISHASQAISLDIQDFRKSDVLHSGQNSFPFTALLTRNTTGGPPIKAMAVESFRLLPPL